MYSEPFDFRPDYRYARRYRRGNPVAKFLGLGCGTVLFLSFGLGCAGLVLFVSRMPAPVPATVAPQTDRRQQAEAEFNEIRAIPEPAHHDAAAGPTERGRRFLEWEDKYPDLAAERLDAGTKEMPPVGDKKRDKEWMEKYPDLMANMEDNIRKAAAYEAAHPRRKTPYGKEK